MLVDEAACMSLLLSSRSARSAAADRTGFSLRIDEADLCDGERRNGAKGTLLTFWFRLDDHSLRFPHRASEINSPYPSDNGFAGDGDLRIIIDSARSL